MEVMLLLQYGIVVFVVVLGGWGWRGHIQAVPGNQIGHRQRRLWRLCYCCSIGWFFCLVFCYGEGEGVYHYIQVGPGNERGHWQWRHWISVGVQLMLLLQYWVVGILLVIGGWGGWRDLQKKVWRDHIQAGLGYWRGRQQGRLWGQVGAEVATALALFSGGKQYF